ncbi:MAG: ADP-forming succinate--CoA ligase subunit beta [SAR202 cluster bacterium]|nr:ADP-forming succinate--CoA ligase subunit beta [SAR202 cluster bacterium]
MKIHEYQAKKILSQGGVPVPKGIVAATAAEAKDAAASIGGKVVVKAQVHAGGRGKAGGVKVVSTPAEAEKAAAGMLGRQLVTFQTGPEGVPVRKVLVEEAIAIKRELYASMVIDGAARGVVVMASEAGGMDIEEVAEKHPEKLMRIVIDPVLGFMPYQGRKVAYGLNVTAEQVRPVADMLSKLYNIFQKNDLTLIEINPLVVTEDGRVLAADAKINLEDDSLFRHADLKEMDDPEQMDALEAQAAKYGISYVKLDGDIGCMVNGAGLAMATMDVTREAGAGPANFLDVGGGADEEKVAQAMRIINSDPNVKKVLINIFGGILKCDIVARGILKVSEENPSGMRPTVVRMLGTNNEEGRKLLAESRLKVTLVNNLIEAADALKGR